MFQLTYLDNSSAYRRSQHCKLLWLVHPLPNRSLILYNIITAICNDTSSAVVSSIIYITYPIFSKYLHCSLDIQLVIAQQDEGVYKSSSSNFQQISRRNFMQIPGDFCIHLSTTEQSLNLQRVSICVVDHKFKLQRVGLS